VFLTLQKSLYRGSFCVIGTSTLFSRGFSAFSPARLTLVTVSVFWKTISPMDAVNEKHSQIFWRAASKCVRLRSSDKTEFLHTDFLAGSSRQNTFTSQSSGQGLPETMETLTGTLTRTHPCR
jgi:hypothetical protein